MAGGSRNHNRIVRNLTRRLGNLLEGSRCEPFSSDTRVHIPACNTYFYPDAQIVCGEVHYDAEEAETLLNPSVIIEVLSPTTESVDRGRKFDCYQTLDSLIYYVLIEQDAPKIGFYKRQTDGDWLFSTRSGLDATLILDAIGVSLLFAEIYQAVEFPPESGIPIPEAISHQ